jgi:hypothetical protein
LCGEVRPSQRPKRGKPTRVDDEYERQDVCHPWMMGEPKRGWRHVPVTARRTREDDVRGVRALVEESSPQAKKSRLVQDHRNTHDGASLSEAFPPQKARRLLDKMAWHSTPKHGSWLHMAETAIGMMHRQCLHCRVDKQDKLATQVAVWESKRHAKEARMHWTFTLAVARQKLHKLYPSIED